MVGERASPLCGEQKEKFVIVFASRSIVEYDGEGTCCWVVRPMARLLQPNSSSQAVGCVSLRQ